MILKMSEGNLQAAVIQFAELRSWRLYHVAKVRKQLRSHTSEGFPDLVMLRGKRQVVVELKREGEDPTPKQWEWLEAFEAVGAETYVWRPADWLGGKVDEVLT